jgi:hypothetical protein
MAGKVKLGLTRNRLFEFCNCVSFVGELEESLEKIRLEKALKMLFLKYPLLSSVTELNEADGEAAVLIGAVNPEIGFLDDNCEAFVSRKINNGIDFCERNFEFYVLNSKILCVFAHTSVADNYFLLALTSELLSVYDKETISIEESPVSLFSESSVLPLKVFSPITEKLSAELEMKWLGRTSIYGVDDYKSARAKYYADEGGESCVKSALDKESVDKLKGFCEKNKVDLSTVVAFCYYEALRKNNISNKKYKKIYFQTNRRCMLNEPSDFIQGAHNGLLELFTEKKKMSSPLKERMIAFHQMAYKAFCSVYNNFEKDFFLMKLSPSFCDSAYMNRVGLNKSKISEKLSKNHLCGVDVAGEFAFINFSQEYYQSFKRFKDVVATEPLKPRTSTFLQFDYNENGARLILKYRSKELSGECAQRVLTDLKKFADELVD